jgi:pimeloyl-ACP methyl ester carboxylesterase
LVGHSFGSYSSNKAVALQPDLADGVVLTGLGYPNATIDLAAGSAAWGPTAFSARIASTVNPNLWPSFTYDTGYVTFADIYNHVDTFFREYEQDAAEYANTIAQPLAVTELTSLATLDLDAGGYKGKVFVTTGEYDLLLCGGECYSTFKTGVQETVWRSADVLETYVHPGSGHGVNFNKNATGFYGEIFSFLDRNF